MIKVVRKVQPRFQAIQFDGENVDELVAVTADKRCPVIRKSTGDPMLADGIPVDPTDWLVMEPGRGGMVWIMTAKDFKAEMTKAPAKKK